MLLDAENEALAAEVLERARNTGATLGTAESCTGGLVAATLTAIPGSSEVVRGGVVSYWAEVKGDVLGVPEDVIETFGVVSERCARAMAEGAARVLGCDYTVSTTGISRPGRCRAGEARGHGVLWAAHAPRRSTRSPPAGEAHVTRCAVSPCARRFGCSWRSCRLPTLLPAPVLDCSDIARGKVLSSSESGREQLCSHSLNSRLFEGGFGC